MDKILFTRYKDYYLFNTTDTNLVSAAIPDKLIFQIKCIQPLSASYNYYYCFFVESSHKIFLDYYRFLAPMPPSFNGITYCTKCNKKLKCLVADKDCLYFKDFKSLPYHWDPHKEYVQKPVVFKSLLTTFKYVPVQKVKEPGSPVNYINFDLLNKDLSQAWDKYRMEAVAKITRKIERKNKKRR